MDTFRKWLNKPKADDKSLLARFYHADRSLTAVASELDSFDGRAEPDRCSRLVSRLRQSQDKVLAITNLIMDELLGEDRDARSFRAKFPEEVLQENLAGQLWFGAECLAAGSSIMNREQESKEMRPLAQAVTKSLGNVRNLLRDQCLRNNVPNSRTLHLDHNDTTTEQLCESLKIFDRLFAEFELRYVSAMVQVKTKHEYEMQELICVLFSETLQRALTNGLLEQDKVDAFDPALMFSIPRLAIIAGLVIYHRGPLNMDMAADQLSEMFRPFRTILIKIRDLLRSLDKNELYQLERLLCTNEDIHLKVEVGSSSIEAPPSSDQQNNNGGSNTTNTSNSNSCVETPKIGETNATPATADNKQADNNNTSSTTTDQTNSRPGTSPKRASLNSASTAGSGSVDHSRKSVYAALRLTQSSPNSTVSGNSSAASTPSVSPAASPTPSHSIASTTSSAVSTSSTSPADWTDDDEDDAAYTDEHENGSESPKELDIVSADCASGFLIPNTNFGNLLQPQEVPLTDNFIASEDEFANNQTDIEEDTYVTPFDLPTTSSASLRNRISNSIHTDSSEDSEQLTIKASLKSSECSSASSASGVSKSGDGKCCSSNSNSNSSSHRQHHHDQQQRLDDKERSGGSSTGSDMIRRHHHHHHAHPHRHHHHHHHHHHHQHKRHQHSKSKRSSLEETANEQQCKDTNASTNVTSTTATTTIAATTTTHWPTGKKPPPSINEDISSADSSTSSSLSDGDPHEVSLAIRAAGRLKFKSTENLLHRLFVCIAGVADQLQTNFASDLRQILRSVFLMNMSSAQEEIIDIPEKTKDSELFEFRASENDVIQESAGSNQSIYSAEEVNPESDNVFNNGGTGSAGIQRVNTFDMGSTSEATAATNARNHIGRSRSLGDQENNETTTSCGSNSNNPNLSSYINGRRLSSPPRQSATQQQQQQQRHRNRNNSVGTNSSASSTSSSSSSESNSPVSERVAATQSGYTHSHSADSVTATNNTNNNNNNNNNNNAEDAAHAATPTRSSQSQSLRLAPPAWIPDEKAPRCMSCHTPFTAFRRRHHCRNCGGVFCGVCSSSSAPLPKYGLTKAVRMCRECYVHEVRGAVSAIRNNVAPLAATTTAGGS